MQQLRSTFKFYEYRLQDHPDYMKKPTTAVHLFRKRADNLHFN